MSPRFAEIFERRGNDTKPKPDSLESWAPASKETQSLVFQFTLEPTDNELSPFSSDSLEENFEKPPPTLKPAENGVCQAKLGRENKKENRIAAEILDIKVDPRVE